MDKAWDFRSEGPGFNSRSRQVIYLLFEIPVILADDVILCYYKGMHPDSQFTAISNGLFMVALQYQCEKEKNQCEKEKMRVKKSKMRVKRSKMRVKKSAFSH